jgi:flagellar biosynthetic protein FliP
MPPAPSFPLPEFRLALGGGDQDGLELSGPVGTVLFIGFLTILPTLLLLMTSFTRILIVLHLLKQALGTQTAPPGHLLAALALILTGFVMAPTLEEANQRGLTPWMEGRLASEEALREAAQPFRVFMLNATRDQDLEQFVQMSANPAPQSPEQIPLVTLTAAFVTSELTSAFQMGFALFLPFLVIDVAVASVLMSMGMFMLPPVMVSLPFKLLLFVLVDGWSLVMGSLVESF